MGQARGRHGPAVPVDPRTDFTGACYRGVHVVCPGWRRDPRTVERPPCLCACHAIVVDGLLADLNAGGGA